MAGNFAERVETLETRIQEIAHEFDIVKKETHNVKGQPIVQGYSSKRLDLNENLNVLKLYGWIGYNESTTSGSGSPGGSGGGAVTSHLHDGHTLKNDGINSDGGAFPFTTTGTVTFNESVSVGGTLGVTGIATFTTYARGIYPVVAADLVTKEYVDDGIWLFPPIEDYHDPSGGLPADPDEGDRYISDGTAGGWEDGYVYEWDGSEWVESIPEEGWMVWMLLELVFWVFFSGGWMEVGSGTYVPYEGALYDVNLNGKNMSNIGTVGCGAITVAANSDITLSGTGHITSGSEGFIVGTLTITDGSIDDTDGSISFGDTAFTAVGTIGCGAITSTGTVQCTDATLTDFANGNETVGAILDDTLHGDVLDEITISDDGGLNISWSAGELWDHTAKDVVETDANAGPVACTDDIINYLYWDRSGGGTALTLSTTPPDITDADVFVATINCASGDIHEINTVPMYSEQIPALIAAFRDIFPSIVTSGLVVSEHAGGGAFDVDMTAGKYYSAVYGGETIGAKDSTVNNLTRWYQDGASSHTAVTAQTIIDTTQWNTGNALTAVTAAKYYRSLFFVDDDGINWVYPTAEYNTVAQAIAGPDPILPYGMQDHPKSTVVIIKGNDAALPAVGPRWIDRRPIIGAEISGTYADHASLANLTWSSAGHTFNAAVDFNAQNISNIGTVGCGAITTSGDLTMSANVANITHSGTTSLTVVSTSGTVTIESVIFTGSAISNATNTNWDAAYAHISNNGSDHSFIDQSVVSGASPTFTGTNFTGLPAPEGTDILSTGEVGGTKFLREDGDGTCSWQAAGGGAPEGTAVLSTGEGGGTKFLREDGDGTCSWQAAAGGGDVTAGAVMTDHSIVRGDGGAKGVQDSGIIIDDTDNVSAMGQLGCGKITSTSTIQGTSVGVGVVPDATTIGKFYRNDASTTAMVQIEQDSTGDATLAFGLTGGQFYSIGVDNSETGDLLKITPAAAHVSTEYWCMNGSGEVSIGSAPQSGISFNIFKQPVDSGAQHSAWFEMDAYAFYANGAYANTALVLRARERGGKNNTASLEGITMQVFDHNTGVLASLNAIAFTYGRDNVAGTCTSAAGLEFQLRYLAGTITSSYDIKILAPDVGGAVTNEFCIWSAHAAPSRLVHDLQIDSNTYGIVLGDGQNTRDYFNGTDLIRDYDLLNSGTTDYRIQEDGTDRLVIETGGNITTTGLTHVQASDTTARSIANASWTDVIFSIEDDDQLGEYDNTTGIFTATNAGTYTISWSVRSASAVWGASLTWIALLSVNNTTVEGTSHYGYAWRSQTGVTSSAHSIGSAIIKLAATDTLRIKVYQNQGAAVDTLGDERNCFFHIARVL